MPEIDLTALEYPRHLHGPDRAFLHVNTADEAIAAVADGWSVEIVRTAAEAAEHRVFQIAAGELPADPTPDPAPAKASKKAK